MQYRPRVSVVMSVFNGESFAFQSIQSVLSQVVSDFEFLIVDDGSTDRTAAILDQLARSDERIQILRRDHRGLPDSLNEAVGRARGRWVARQDVDDESLPTRLREQLAWFQSHPDGVACGTGGTYLDEQGRVTGRYRVWPRHSSIRRRLVFHNVLVHSSVMFSRSAFAGAGGYDPFFEHAQDYDLWCRLAARGELGCLPRPLVRHRRQSSSISKSRRDRQGEYGVLAAAREWARRRRIELPCWSRGEDPGPIIQELLGHPQLGLHLRALIYLHDLGSAGSATRWRQLDRDVQRYCIRHWRVFARRTIGELTGWS